MAIYSFIAEEQATDDNDWTVAEMCRVWRCHGRGSMGGRTGLAQTAR